MRFNHKYTSDISYNGTEAFGLTAALLLFSTALGFGLGAAAKAATRDINRLRTTNEALLRAREEQIKKADIGDW
jgi:hypothetical protein